MVEWLEPRTLCAVGAAVPAPAAWFRAASINATSGAPVTTWTDSSGHGYSATQPDAARRPHWVSEGLNGRAAVRFDAASSTNLAFTRPVYADFSIVVVFASTQGTGHGQSWYDGAGLVDAEVAGVTSDFGVSLNASGQVLAGTGAPDTSVDSGAGFDDGRGHVATFTRSSATGELDLYVDGRLFERASAGTQALYASPRLTIGSLQTNTHYFTGDVSEVRVYGSVLAGDQRTAIEAELTAAYNIAPPPTAWFTNPVINANFPDPGAVYAGGSYYAFATNGAGRNVQAARSSDLVHWTTLPDALPALPSWAQAGRTWAPDVAVTASGHYSLYYTAWSASTGRQAIGVATATTPAGPFAPAGSAPLVSQVSQGGAIDPSVFTDASGAQYLLWKNDGNAIGQVTNLYIQRLSADGLSLVGSATPLIHADQPWEGGVVEAPTLWAHGGKYYLFYSANNFANGSYAVGYAVSNSLLGPYTKPAAPLSTTTGPVVGPGGEEIVVGPDGNTWMLYHSWENNLAYRSLSADRLEWAGDVPVLRGPTRVTQPAPVASRVLGRYTFYNHSAFDGRDAAANSRDDAAIASDKQALLPGQSASFANVTSYSRGINGVMIDVTALPQSLAALQASGFGVQVGAGGSAGWTSGPVPASVTVRRGAGINGSDRLTLTWPDGAIRNRWLRITVPAGAATGLATPDVFAFANLAGDAGTTNPSAPPRVDAADVVAVLRARATSGADVINRLDFNRDGRVDVRDLVIARANLGKSLAALLLA
jgi:hypothetical protein